jgi:Protein of unknown function DUF262
MGVTLSDLVERFDSGEIRLPLMQREYVWRPKKGVRLLDSLYRRWPIGSSLCGRQPAIGPRVHGQARLNKPGIWIVFSDFY